MVEGVRFFLLVAAAVERSIGAIVLGIHAIADACGSRQSWLDWKKAISFYLFVAD